MDSRHAVEHRHPVWDLLTTAAELYSDRLALTTSFGDGYRYGALPAEIASGLNWFNEAGVGSPVLFVPGNRPEDVLAILAAIIGGHRPLIGDATWTTNELRQIAASTGASTVVSANWSASDSGTASQPAWHGMASRRFSDEASNLSGRQVAAFGRFTSGSTGFARCLGFSQDAAINAARGWAAASGLSAEDTVLCLATLNNGLAFNTSLLSVLAVGARLVLHAGRAIPSSIMRAARMARPTILVAFPFVFDALVGADLGDLGRLRLALSSAAPLSSQTERGWLDQVGLPICNYYGLAEVGPVTFNDGGVEGSVGRLLPGVEVEVERNADLATPPGVGRLLVRTRSMATCYLDDQSPDLSACIERGYYRTNDVGRLDTGGHVFLVSRLGEVANIAGRKVDPGEVADVIRALPAVRDVLVRREAADGGDVLAAYVESPSLARAELIEHCQLHLADYKLPQKIVITHSLPRSSTNKVVVARLGELASGRT